MYISRRVDIIGPPVWKSTSSPHLSKSELASLRPWQSEHQRCMLSPLHHHMLTLPGYPTTPSHTRNPSDIKHDRIQYTTPSPVNSYQPFTMFTTYRLIFACTIRLSPPPGLPTLLLTHVGIPSIHSWGTIKKTLSVWGVAHLFGSCRRLLTFTFTMAGEPLKTPIVHPQLSSH